MIVVTGNGDLPLATQRRVERRASLLIDRPSPSLDRIYQLGLWSAIFFAIFLRIPPNKFLRIPPDLSPVSIRLALLFLLLRVQCLCYGPDNKLYFQVGAPFTKCSSSTSKKRASKLPSSLNRKLLCVYRPVNDPVGHVRVFAL